MKTVHSSSSKATQKFGEAFAEKILKKKNGPIILALRGELGAGKTTFVQGFLRGIGLKKNAQSPTFIIMRRHRIKRGKFKNLFHIDAYRLKRAKQLAVLGFKEILIDPRNVILVEWPERIKKIMPKGTVWMSFKHGKQPHERIIAY